MKLKKILLENRIDDFKLNYSKKFNSEQLKRIIDNVPQKYLMWVGKNFDSINFNSNINDLAIKLREFDKISSNLPLTDINSYKNLEQLSNALLEYANRPRRQIKQVEGGNVVYDDDRYFVVNPLTHQASCYYGKGTKWCTASDSDYQFKQYNDDAKLFYILDKTKSTSDLYYKIALLRKFNGDKIFFDAQDNTIKNIESVVEPNFFKEIMGSIDDYLNTEYAGQMKIFSDIALAKKERERIERLRIERILQGRREGAQSRRENGEWSLGPNCPEEGLKAHALLDYLDDNGDVEVMTNDDRLELQKLIDEKERIETEYDEDEEFRRDILDRIDEIDEEIEEIQSKVDVYYIIPTGNHYDCDEFQVIDVLGLEDRRYAVGTDDEMQSSSYECVDNLIEDIGYEGFSKSFIQDYIDSDLVADEAEGIYDNDVRENPDAYLDESERELSDEQVEQINILKMKIEKNKKFVEKLENDDYDDDDDEIQEKIDEINEIIEEYESEIEDIESSPEGYFPEDIIADKVDSLVNAVRRDPEWFISDIGLDWKDYINKDELIKGVIDADGYGHTLNSYDGTADEVYVNGQLFYVMRID
jgi:hypothetical protein